MFFILGVKNNSFISELDTIFELWQGPFVSFGQWKALYVLVSSQILVCSGTLCEVGEHYYI